MPEPEQQPTTISVEAFEREKRRAEAAEAKVAELTGTLTSYTKRDKAREFFQGKVENPDAFADIVTPHLADVELDKVADVLGSDRFKPLLAASTPSPGNGSEPPADGQAPSTDGATSEPTAATPPAGFGAGPSPGSTAGAQPVGTAQKIRTDSPEYKAAIAANDAEQIEKWDKDGLLERPARPWT